MTANPEFLTSISTMRFMRTRSRTMTFSLDAAAAVWNPVESGLAMYGLREQKRMISCTSAVAAASATAAGRGSHCEPSLFITSGFM